MEISDIQSRRAANQVWNGAKNYDFVPDFKVFSPSGSAELYWNSIIGAAHSHYDYRVFEKLFTALEQYEDSELYEGLFWLALENCVYEREVRVRPVLRQLRERYAHEIVDSHSEHEDYHLLDKLSSLHFRLALGEKPALDPYSAQLLEDMKLSSELSAEKISEKACAFFEKWFQIDLKNQKKQKPKLFQISLMRKKVKLREAEKLRRFASGFAFHPENAYGGIDTKAAADQDKLATKMTAEELRRFMEVKYGKSALNSRQITELEKKLCSGRHESCHLHITNGERIAGEIQNGFEALHRRKEIEQIQKNRELYRRNIETYRTIEGKLTEKIQNSILLHLQACSGKADNGSLNAVKAWRAIYLDDSKVFTKSLQDDAEDLSVDILLDASTSQKGRQELISNQAYIIARSLTRCAVPCRVSSFCSMTGYTILRVFRDYSDYGKNEKIFEYVSNGCNRDGLAVRTLHHMLNSSAYGHKLLIILSDVKPNDVIKIRESSAGEPELYQNQAGLRDTAYEVRKARADEISVMCVFTGADEDVPSARLVYGQDFARIKSIEMLAETVGGLIQNQIKNI